MTVPNGALVAAAVGKRFVVGFRKRLRIARYRAVLFAYAKADA